nr:hypothetical protein Iba_chr01aCG5190 [Ipomoea batatas]GMC51207.1 hypothetical protein Iba_chr01cCG4070 [Ipomoea batatas]GMC86769.1 hypothetical protein Iba_chr04dCG13940 [Ipomoea batatas]GME20601.1 hypothetical protein Iba_scaffold25591CG0020 [Ipomoea batatas]
MVNAYWGLAILVAREWEFLLESFHFILLSEEFVPLHVCLLPLM